MELDISMQVCKYIHLGWDLFKGERVCLCGNERVCACVREGQDLYVYIYVDVCICMRGCDFVVESLKKLWR